MADGVGGWALSGVDSGEYSRLLMQMAQLFAESKKLDAHPKKVHGRCASVALPRLDGRQLRGLAILHQSTVSDLSGQMTRQRRSC